MKKYESVELSIIQENLIKLKECDYNLKSFSLYEPFSFVKDGRNVDIEKLSESIKKSYEAWRNISEPFDIFGIQRFWNNSIVGEPYKDFMLKKTGEKVDNFQEKIAFPAIRNMMEIMRMEPPLKHEGIIEYSDVLRKKSILKGKILVDLEYFEPTKDELKIVEEIFRKS